MRRLPRQTCRGLAPAARARHRKREVYKLQLSTPGRSAQWMHSRGRHMRDGKRKIAEWFCRASCAPQSAQFTHSRNDYSAGVTLIIARKGRWGEFLYAPSFPFRTRTPASMHLANWASVLVAAPPPLAPALVGCRLARIYLILIVLLVSVPVLVSLSPLHSVSSLRPPGLGRFSFAYASVYNRGVLDACGNAGTGGARARPVLWTCAQVAV